MSSASVIFAIPPQAYQDLADLAELSDKLKAAQDALPSDPNSKESTVDAVAQALELDSSQLKRALRGLSSLTALMRGTKLAPADLFDAVTESIPANAPGEWKAAHFEKWQKAKDAIVNAISRSANNEFLNAQIKTRELTYLHDNIFGNCRLLTEVRPVFNVSGDKIVNSVLTTSLVVKYTDHAQDQKQITFAMDLNDLVELRSQCERALRKVAATEQMFNDATLKLTVAGESKQEKLT